MTGWGVERKPRAAHPTSVPPTGVSSLMPPHSQGAERRTERRAGRTGSRWALRALVIGGLAGAAWLLTGAAAHAADRDPASEGLLGSSLIGAVVDGDSASPAVSKVLKVAAQPLERDRTAHQHVAASSVLAAPARVLTRPAQELTDTVLTETLDQAGTKKNNAVDRIVRDLTGPLRLTGGPADSRQLAPVAAPLTSTLSTATDLLQHAADPVSDQGATPATPAPGDAAATRTADRVAAHSVPVTGIVGHRDTVARDAVAAARSVSKRHSIVTERHHRTEVTAAAPDMVQRSTPDGDGPAPLQVQLGVSGISTSGPGAPTEGGSAAVLPAAVAGDTVAVHRLLCATDVEVRRHDAEAPTVSPD